MFSSNNYIEENGNFKIFEETIKHLPEIEIFRLIIIHENNIVTFKKNKIDRKTINEEKELLNTVKGETVRFGVNNEDDYLTWYAYWTNYFSESSKRELKKYEKELKKITSQRPLVETDLMNYRPHFAWQDYINILS